ncbi:unnamed protein product [Alopecurus aequalis]
MAQPTPVPVMGIDLGTTNSCVGVWVNGCVEIVPSEQGTRTTPSCVAFTDSERLIGDGANHQVGTNASNTVFNVKRLIGRSFSDASVQSDAKYWPFGVMVGSDEKPLIKVSYLGKEKEFTPEEISAMVLVKMKETAEAYVGATITDAVITVPAYFDGSQRQATKDAAAIAGLNVLRIMSEPTAAALAYSCNTNWKNSTVLVYDLGGGTLDVSLVVITNSGLQVKATAGDTHLGGEDFVNNMVDHFVTEFGKKSHKDIRGDKKALGRLRRSCEEAKRRLSTNPAAATTVEVDALFEGIDFHSTITRDKFELLNVDLFHRCMVPVVKCLEDAKMDKTMVHDVVLVGGSTRIPRVQQLVQEFFLGKLLCRNINADEAVAYGATVQAAIIRDQNPRYVRDIMPFSLGIGLLEGMLVHIRRHSTIPVCKVIHVTTTEDNQSSLGITVYEVETAMAKEFRLSGIASALKGVPEIKVRFYIDQDGILQASAQEQESDLVVTNGVGRLSKEEIGRMRQKAQEYKAQDKEHKNKVQARNDIEKLVYSVRNTISKLQEDKDSAARLLPGPEEEIVTPTPQQSASRFGHGKEKYSKYNTHDKENKKKMEAQNDNIKKLQDIADATTTWLNDNDKECHSTEIIRMKDEMEGQYNQISSQIESASKKNILLIFSNGISKIRNAARN